MMSKKTHQKILAFLKRPKIKHKNFKQTFKQAAIFFCATIPFVFIAIEALKYLIPGYLQIDPIPLINKYIFTIMLTTTAAGFGAILFLICSLMLLPKAPKLHHAIFNHAIWVYAVLNIFIGVITVIALNRIMFHANIQQRTSDLDLWIGGIVGIVALATTGWLLIEPIAAYFNQYYGKLLSYSMSLSAVVLAFSLNPVIAIPYFNNAINQGEFCKQWTAITFKEDFEMGTLNKDCVIRKCLAAKSQNNACN